MTILPQKLIAVGMRHRPGAEAYLKGTPLPCPVTLVLEENIKASGNKAYIVLVNTNHIAYIREADLPDLKYKTNMAKVIEGYEITQKYPNYLLLKLGDTYKVDKPIEVETPRKTITAAEDGWPQPNKITEKEITMFDKIVAANKTVAVSAAYLEAGRMANNQVAKLVGAKAPLMVRGYVDTPIGKLVLANLTAMAVEQFRPADAKLKKVSNAMMANAYQDLIRTIDIEGMLNELTSSEGIKNALAAVAGQEQD